MMKGRTGLLKGGWKGGRARKGAKAYLDDLACSAPGCCCQRAYLFFFFGSRFGFQFLRPPFFCQPRAILACLIDKCWAILSVDYLRGGKRHVGTVYVDACAREE